MCLVGIGVATHSDWKSVFFACVIFMIILFFNHLDSTIMMNINLKNISLMIQYLQQLIYYQPHQRMGVFIHLKMPDYLFVNEFELNHLKVNVNILIPIHIHICESIKVIFIVINVFCVSHFCAISIF